MDWLKIILSCAGKLPLSSGFFLKLGRFYVQPSFHQGEKLFHLDLGSTACFTFPLGSPPLY